MGYGWSWETLRAYQARLARQLGASGPASAPDVAVELGTGRLLRVAGPERIPEADVLAAVLLWLAGCPAVAWVERMNVGGVWHGEQYVRYGVAGMADITGQLIDGRRLEVEVKASDGGTLSSEQAAWLERVKLYGGVAFVAAGVADCVAVLGDY